VGFVVGAYGHTPLRIRFIRAKDTLRAYADIAHTTRMKFKIPVIGITGSTGKTTTKELPRPSSAF